MGRDFNRTLSISYVAVALTVSACMHDQKLAWQDTSQNENGFRIYRVVGQEKRLVGEVGANVTQFIDRRAPAGACYIVTAFNDEGESPPTSVACGKDG
ncbi:MAG TPA: hypothetical protein VFK65_19690 [Candidatus Binatia bacterium]|nr:hypothetical protein [Candidatus Binatia bacterium]